MKLAQRLLIGYYVNKIRALAIISPRKAAEEAFRLFCTPYSKRKVHAAPVAFEKANKLTFQLGEYVIKGFRWTPDNQMPHKRILICHGFDSRSYKFDEYITLFLGEGFEVLAFDAPAHGLSSGATINANQYSDMITEIDLRFGPVHGILAHSFGCLAVALAVEKMNGHDQKRVVLIAPATETTHAIKTFFKYIQVSAQVKEEFEKIIEEMGGHPASWFSVSRVMQQISMPVFWIHDQEDPITPFTDMEHLLHKSLSHIQFEITKGLGHSNIYRDKRIVKKVVSFLAALK